MVAKLTKNTSWLFAALRVELLKDRFELILDFLVKTRQV